MLSLGNTGQRSPREDRRLPCLRQCRIWGIQDLQVIFLLVRSGWEEVTEELCRDGDVHRVTVQRMKAGQHPGHGSL